MFHGLLVYLVTLVITGYLGGYVAEKAGINRIIGILVGVVFHLVGLAALAAFWGIKTLSATEVPPPGR